VTDSPTRDDSEAERFDPDQRLIERRQIRYDDEYRAWCELSYGMIELGQEVFHPADVLDALAPDAARRGRDDATTQVRADLEQIVCEEFPAPIAVPFYGFLEGPRQSLTRLHRLRDTWESLVRLLAALALSEAARSAASLAPLSLREGKDQGWRECKRRDLCSDKLAVRIGLIEGVLHRAEEAGIGLQIASLLPMDVLGEIRRLNAVRNGFSHESTKSDAQAKAIIDEAYPVVREVLLDLRDMQGIELLRIHSIQAGGNAEVERLNGHAQSRRISELALDEGAASVAMSATTIDGMARVLARVGELTLDLSPFLYAADDETGHRTRVWDFKSKKGNEWHMECVADSTIRSSPAALHEALLASVDTLLGSAGDGA
jgi:hypothetical protein